MYFWETGPNFDTTLNQSQNQIQLSLNPDGATRKLTQNQI